MRAVSGLFARRTSPPERIELKSAREIDLIRAAGSVVRCVLEEMGRLVRPGATTAVLADAADRIIAEHGGQPLFRGVRNPSAKIPFPAPVCVSVNDEVVHGIPGSRVLKEGDIVSIDCGVRLRGYCGDAAETFPVGTVSGEAARLLNVTSQALALAIAEMRPGRRWSEVAAQVQRFVEQHGFSVVREFVGHGIGRQMHEEPKVPNYTDRQQRKADFVLEPGLVIAVEPMVTAGSAAVRCIDPTGWTQVTQDGRLAAHFEHTVAMTPQGVDVLTVGRRSAAAKAGGGT